MGCPEGHPRGHPLHPPKTGLYLTGETGLPLFPPLPPSSPIPFPLQPCSPWGSWAAPPIVGVDTGKGQWSHQLPWRWGRSSFWPAEREGKVLGLHRDLCSDKGKVVVVVVMGGAPGTAHPPSWTLTIRTGLMAPVAWSSSEQRREGRHAGVPPTHQQLLYAWHLPLQCVGAAGDFGKERWPSWGPPGWGIQPWWLGLGRILAGGTTAAMVGGWEGPNATVQGSSQGAAGWGREYKSPT